MSLPENIDAVYSNDPQRPGTQLHQAHHDTIHNFINNHSDGGDGSTMHITVAAFDAPTLLKDRADYVCDQVDDAVIIQQALDTSTGVSVLLSQGNYYFPTSDVTLGPNENLVGLGKQTYIYGPDNAAAVTCGPESLVEGIGFSYFNTGTGSVGVQAADFCTISRCTFEDLATGIDLASTGRVRVSDCTFDVSGWGVDDTIANYAVIESCKFEGGTSGNIRMNGGSNRIVNCTFIVDGVSIFGDENMILGNHFETSATLTFETGATGNAFASNFMEAGATDYTDSGTATQKPTNSNFSSAGLW